MPATRKFPVYEDHSASQDTATDGQKPHEEQNSPFDILCRAADQQITELSENIQETEISDQSSANTAMLARNPELSHGETLPLASGAQRQVAGAHVTEARSGTADSAMTPQVGTGNALDTPGVVTAIKRRREEALDLSTQDAETQSSDGGIRYSKRTKVDCDCDTNHSWLMTIFISDLNGVLQRIRTAIGLVGMLADRRGDLFKVEIGDLVNILKDSQGILESAKDDMRGEGGTDRESFE